MGEFGPAAAVRREGGGGLAAARVVPRAAPIRGLAAAAAAALIVVAGALLLYEGMTARHERVLAAEERAVPLVIAQPRVPFVSFTVPEATEQPVMAVPASASGADTAWDTAP